MLKRRYLSPHARHAAGMAFLRAGLLLLPVVALAQGGGGLTNPIGCDDLGVCIANLVKGVLALVGVVAVAFIVYGGFLYISAGGNETQVQQGKQAVVGAVIGIIVVGLAFAIVEFVFGALKGGGGGGGGVR